MTVPGSKTLNKSILTLLYEAGPTGLTLPQLKRRLFAHPDMVSDSLIRLRIAHLRREAGSSPLTSQSMWGWETIVVRNKRYVLTNDPEVISRYADTRSRDIYTRISSVAELEKAKAVER